MDPTHPDNPVLLQHSAGTTGLQKGVVLSHRQVLRQLRKLARHLELDQTDRIASWLPLYHDMGLIACFLLPLTAGLHIVVQSPDDWVVRHTGSTVGSLEVTAGSREGAIEKMRGELQYRLELCPCSGETYQHVHIELVEGR